LLAVISALALVAYPTWGELKNPGLWMFAIVAAVTGVARAYWMQIDVGGVLPGWTGGCRGVRSRSEPQADLHDHPSLPLSG